MRVFKFGGASVNSASAIRNVATILKKFNTERLVVVFSAMGKTTNAMEQVVNSAFYKKPDIDQKIEIVEMYHQQITDDLFQDAENPVHHLLQGLIGNIRDLVANPDDGYDEFYDRLVPYGEFISTGIISAWFDEIDLKNILLPAPSLVKTNSHFRDASVDWKKTENLISGEVNKIFSENSGHIIITQGFIGGTADGRRTTLGREGSDFTASIFAFCLNADSVTVWKDVEGLLNADPVYFKDTRKIEHLSYKEAIELAFYGAKILHPKTIKPLQNKSIPLEIRSFSNPEAPGSVIHDNDKSDQLSPFLILKKDQVLVSFSTRDFSFITEDKLHQLFGVFNNLSIKINMMQNSAISFTICTNHPGTKLPQMVGMLTDEFEIRYNEGLELLTIRNFSEELVKQHLSHCKVFLEQRSRRTIQLAYKREIQA